MTPPESLREVLMRDEGYRRLPYRDTVNKLTVGFGRNIEEVGLSFSEAEFLLDNDITKATSAVIAALPWTRGLDEVRRGVLVNMAFMGIGKVLEFRKMLDALQAGDYERAAKELLDSKYRRQVGMRAERLAESLRTGEWR